DSSFGCVVETDHCSPARTPVYAVHNVHRIRTGMPKAHSNNVSDLPRQLFFLGCARAPFLPTLVYPCSVLRSNEMALDFRCHTRLSHGLPAMLRCAGQAHP